MHAHRSSYVMYIDFHRRWKHCGISLHFYLSVTMCEKHMHACRLSYVMMVFSFPHETKHCSVGLHFCLSVAMCYRCCHHCEECGASVSQWLCNISGCHCTTSYRLTFLSIPISLYMKITSMFISREMAIQMTYYKDTKSRQTSLSCVTKEVAKTMS